VVLRRRKVDLPAGDIVAKHRHTLRLTPSSAQAEASRLIMEDHSKSITSRLNALRMAALHGPKLEAAIELARGFVQEGNGTILFSPFTAPLDLLQDRLTQLGIRSLVCDGRMSPNNRAEAAALFQAGQVPVLLCSQDSMAEGYSFPDCSRILVLGHHWAMDKGLQCEDRGWRLNSVEDLHVWILLTKGTIDELMDDMARHKTATAEAVLDGILTPAPVVPLNEMELWKHLQQNHPNPNN
jgi:SNF2 family DNA or RNA helicase